MGTFCRFALASVPAARQTVPMVIDVFRAPVRELLAAGTHAAEKLNLIATSTMWAVASGADANYKTNAALEPVV